MGLYNKSRSQGFGDEVSLPLTCCARVGYGNMFETDARPTGGIVSDCVNERVC